MSGCAYCGGEPLTAGFNHRLGCAATLTTNTPFTIRPYLGPRAPVAATVMLTLRFVGGREVSVGHGITVDEMLDDVIEQQVRGDLLREFLRVIREAGVTVL